MVVIRLGPRFGSSLKTLIAALCMLPWNAGVKFSVTVTAPAPPGPRLAGNGGRPVRLNSLALAPVMVMLLTLTVPPPAFWMTILVEVVTLSLLPPALIGLGVTGSF